MTFDEIIAQHIGVATRRQLALRDFLGEHNWHLDLDKGTVDFGKASLFSRRRVYPVQVIGTESEQSLTWLWSWANEASNLPAHVLRAAGRLRAHGESKAVRELVTPQLPSETFPGHLLASVASGVCSADAYYRGPYEGGAVFLLVFESPLKAGPPTPVPRVITVLSEVISQYEVDHRSMATSYLRAEGFRLTDTSGGVSATASDGRSLSVSFDQLGRISEVQAQVA